MKYCLMSKFTETSKECQEYLLNPKYRKEAKTEPKTEPVAPADIDTSSYGSEITDSASADSTSADSTSTDSSSEVPLETIFSIGD